MNERQYLFREFEAEVNKDYASIVTTAWGIAARAKRPDFSAPKIKSLLTEVAGMERAALLVIKNHEYLDGSVTPEKRLKEDKERYRVACEKDAESI